LLSNIGLEEFTDDPRSARKDLRPPKGVVVAQEGVVPLPTLSASVEESEDAHGVDVRVRDEAEDEGENKKDDDSGDHKSTTV